MNQLDTDLERLLRKMEVEQKLAEMNLQFAQNLEAIRALDENLYDEFRNYQPKTLRIEVDNEGLVNLRHIQTGDLAYNEDPRIQSGKQVDAFLRAPAPLVINGGHNNESSNPKYRFARMINRLQEDLGNPTLDFADFEKKPLPLLVVNGVGFGYHIELLIERLDIMGVVINDGSKDSFFASLFTIDWQRIIDYFRMRGRFMLVQFDKEPRPLISSIKGAISSAGAGHLGSLFYFSHIKSDMNNAFEDIFKREVGTLLEGAGFIEDEQVGLAHTVQNLIDAKPLLRSVGAVKDLPVFVIGNGPSLDNLLPYIKKNEAKAILISCGTTLSTLFKAGIKPDIHVEQERPYAIKQWLERGTTPDYRAGIKMIGLNTVHPETLGLFNDSYIIAKPNDIGTDFLRHIGIPDLMEAPFSNPTVVNFGFSVAVLLGFRNVTLLGADFGMHDADKHHATSSIQFDVAEREDSQRLNMLEVKGNLRDKVLTQYFLNIGRQNIEQFLIDLDGMTVMNPNDGAYIQGAVPVPEGQMKDLSAEIDKPLVCGEIFSEIFEVVSDATSVDSKTLKSGFLKPFFNLRKHLKLPPKKPAADEFFRIMVEQSQLVQSSHGGARLLLQGPVSVFAFFFARSCIWVDDEIAQYNYQLIRSCYNDYLSFGFGLMRDAPLALDDLNHDFETGKTY